MPARNGGSRKDTSPGKELFVTSALGPIAVKVGAGTALTATDKGTAALVLGNNALSSETDANIAAAIVAGIAASDAACGNASDIGAAALLPNSHCIYGNTVVGGAQVHGENYNYDGSINTDDGRLNFDKDDLIGGTFKVTTELEAQTGDFTFFARVNAFYDAILADDSSFARSKPLKNANRAQAYDVDMLDFYVDWSSEVANLPFTLRAGRQVINWGEATFILGGNSVFNPISVPAFRRPGSEIKEALLPVMAIYGSLSLPYDLTLEAYAGGWDSYDIDPRRWPICQFRLI